MKKTTLQKRRISLLFVLTILTGTTNWLIAQTDPTAQSLPFSYTSITGSTLPAGVAVHRFGTTTGAIPTSRITTPANGDLPYSAASPFTSGGWLNAGTSGADGIGVLASGSNAAGGIVIAINTVGKTNIKVDWKAKTILQQNSRDNSLALQYRIGTSGNFTDLGGPLDVYTSAGQTVGTGSSYSITLPAGLEGEAVVQLRWIYWESAGTAGSRDRIALDDVTIAEAVAGPDVTAPIIGAPFSPADNATNVVISSNLRATFSEAITKLVGNIVVTNTTDNTSQVISVSSSDVSVSSNIVTINGVTLLNGKSYAVTMDAGSFEDLAGNDFAGIADATTWNFSTIAPFGVATKISAIQGSGPLAALTGQYSIEGIVTRTFFGANGLNGFYVQEQDTDADSDPATSEAIFVYNVASDPVGLLAPNPGDLVRLSGTVDDFVSTSGAFTSRLTEIKNITTFENDGPGTLPVVVSVKLPVANVSDLERYEGMLVNLSATTGNLTVTEYFQLGRFGQVTLSVDGAGEQPGTDARLDQFTQFNAPSVANYATHLAALARRKIILDDGSGRQNPDPIIFGRGGNPLSASNTLRGGDQATNIVGILDERFEGYRIQSATGVNFLPSNPRPSLPPSVEAGKGARTAATATLKVASANVLNYFTTLDGGEDLYRGANTAAEFTRQKAKIIKGLIESGADVLGLMEVQSNGPSFNTALADLVAGLNAASGSSGDYSFIDPTTTATSISTDAITVAIVFKTGKVTPVGNPATLTGNAAFARVRRWPLAQTFKQNSNDEEFTLVVNHFKSKGSSAGGPNDTDASDGQGDSNGTRTEQATALATWLATNPTGTVDPDYLLIGDLNAYAKEDPIRALENAGFINQLATSSYSYVFDGQVGSLDHALATSSLDKQITGTAKWHINADEPGVLDYNVEFKSTGQITSLYAADQFRASDHDPILIGLALTNPLPVNYISFKGSAVNGNAVDQKIKLTWETTSEKDNAGFEILKSKTGINFEKIGFLAGKATTASKSSYEFDDFDVAKGQLYYYQLRQTDFDGTTDLSRIIAVRVESVEAVSHAYPNPNAGSFLISGDHIEGASIRFFNVLGREIQVTSQETATRGVYSVKSKSSLSPGLYYIKIQNADHGNEQTVKVLIR